MNIVDPMHDLFLRSGKHLLKILKENGYVSKSYLEKIQEKPDGFVVPHDFDKISGKIVNSFDGFNADEYKNWLLLFSVYSMDGTIPSKDKECLRKLVIASTYLCKKFISKKDLVIAHEYLLKFCNEFELLYSEDQVASNMHLDIHIKDCILDYGPIYSF